MRRLVLACGFLMACSSTGGGAAEVAPASRTLSYRADTVRYVLSGHRKVEQEFQGQVTVQESRLGAWIRTALGAAGPEGLPARIVLDSVSTTGNVFAPGDLTGIRGATWTGRLLPTGELVDMDGPTAPGIANQMFNMVSDFYPRLPAAGVVAGDAWVDTVTSEVDVGGVTLTIVTVNRSEAVGPSPWEGGDAFLVRVVSDYTLSGEGSQSGQPLSLDGSGRRHAWEYLSLDGRYVAHVVADTSSYDVMLTALGMAIPGRQWRHDTLRVAR